MVEKLGLPKDHEMTEKVWSAISFFLSDKSKDFKSTNDSALDIFSSLLSKRLKYEKGERDMVAMHHEFGIEHSSGKKVRFLFFFYIYISWVFIISTNNEIGNIDINID